MRFVIAPIIFLAGALVIHAAGEPGIIKGSDQFEFVYRVKLPEIKARPASGYRWPRPMLFKP
jgi:hypothetical protein